MLSLAKEETKQAVARAALGLLPEVAENLQKKWAQALRDRVSRVLVSIGRQAGEPLLETLRHEHPETLRVAARMFRDVGASAAPALAQRLLELEGAKGEEAARVRKLALGAAVRIGEAVVSSLVARVEQGLPADTAAVEELLVRLCQSMARGSGPEETRAAITRLCASAGSRVAAGLAERVLGRLRGEALRPLVGILKDAGPGVAEAASRALARIGAPAAAPLIHALKAWAGADPPVAAAGRVAKAESILASIGSAAVPELVWALTNEKGPSARASAGRSFRLEWPRYPPCSTQQNTT